jgi:hypothetical protein
MVPGPLECSEIPALSTLPGTVQKAGGGSVGGGSRLQLGFHRFNHLKIEQKFKLLLLFTGSGSADSYSIRNSVVLFIQKEMRPTKNKFPRFLTSLQPATIMFQSGFGMLQPLLRIREILVWIRSGIRTCD